MSELIRLERDGPIGILRFLEAKKRNPYSMAFVEELVAHLRDAERDRLARKQRVVHDDRGRRAAGPCSEHVARVDVLRPVAENRL